MDGSNNLTWVVGHWRLYVAEQAAGWLWNLRQHDHGWEMTGNATDREAAIIAGLNAAQSVDNGSYIFGFATIVNGGEPHSVHASPSLPVDVFIASALKANGYDRPYPPHEWELRTFDGYLIPNNTQIGIGMGKLLNVTLKAGVGA